MLVIIKELWDTFEIAIVEDLWDKFEIMILINASRHLGRYVMIGLGMTSPSLPLY